MSTVEETFYGIKCDYPECGDVYEGEYSYWASPGDAHEYAGDSGWLVDFEGKDYCESHTQQLDEEDDDDEHRGLRPLPETFEAQLEVSARIRLETAHRRLRGLERKLNEDLGSTGYHHLSNRTRSKLDDIFEKTVRAFKPDITNQEIFDLRRSTPLVPDRHMF